MRILATLTLCSATPVWADCPVASDLATGVAITETDGTVNLFLAMGGGVVMNEGTAPSGYTYRNLLAQGTHLMELGDTENGSYVPESRRDIDYGLEPGRCRSQAPTQNGKLTPRSPVRMVNMRNCKRSRGAR